jgi:hypothetical protein
MTKFFGFLLGIAVACALPAAFGVLAADGGIELSTKELALAYGIGALVFWGVISFFTGAGALGAALAFGTMIYAVHWIPNRTTNFLNDVPGVTTGMIEGLKSAVLSGVVPILAVISLIYSIQLITGAVRRRRLRRAEEARLAQEQADAAEQEQAAVTSQYPVAEEYPTRLENQYAVDDGYDKPYRYDEPAPAFTSEPTAQFVTTADVDSAYQTQEFAADEQTQPFAADERRGAEEQTIQLAAGQQLGAEEQRGAAEEARGADEQMQQFAADEQHAANEQTQFAVEQSTVNEAATKEYKAPQAGSQYRERMDEPDTGWNLIAIPAEDPAQHTTHRERMDEPDTGWNLTAIPADDPAQHTTHRERMDEPDTGWDLIAIPAEDTAQHTTHYHAPRLFRPATEYG